ncbi:solute carrier family 23 protein [Limibacillus sp. MBR-115]|jgi:uracil permease|uniref:solute carrier family 23 protein n=1 Tax=Limibacillus sp. MBR-115 TaxID=3156465 RepID=UPI00339AE995
MSDIQSIDVGQRPTGGLWAILSLQHLFAMFGATVLVPILTGLPPEVALVSSGLGTLIYLLCTGGLVPGYLGSSFAFIGPIVAGAALAGTSGALFGAFCAGGVYLLVAALVRGFGVGWLMRLLPPVVVGPIIMVIGLGLASIAVGMAQGTIAGGPYNLTNFLVALVTLGAILFFSLVLKGFFSVIPIILGIGIGYIVALIAGLVDFTPVAEAPLFRVPGFVSFLGGFGEGGIPWGVLPILVPVALVTIAEHIGDTVVLSRVVGRNYLKTPGLHRTLLGDGLATMAAAVIGGPPNTTYGENIGVLAITRVYSVWVIGGAAVLAILLGFLGTVAAFLGSIPTAVMGGVSIALFGVIASSGIRTLIEGKVDFGERRNLLVASVILVIGIGGATLQISDQFTISSMALAAIVGVALHALLPDRHLGGDTETVLGGHG